MPLSASSPRWCTATNWPRPSHPNVQSKLSSAAFDATAYFDIGGPTEPFEGVVTVHVHLDVLERAATPDALEGDAVQLVVGAELDAGKLDAHVAERATIV